MDVADIQTVTQLSQEKQSIQTALDSLASGGRINAMVVGPPAPTSAMPFGGRPFGGVSVPTAYIEYPPQMVEAIKTAFEGRLHVIEDELTKLGVTGMKLNRAEPQKKK